MFAVFIIMVAVAGVAATRFLVGRTTRAASQAITAPARGRARNRMRRTVTFTTPEAPAVTSQEIVTAVNALSSPPPRWGKLFLASRSDSGLVFELGSEKGTAARYRVSLASASAGTSGSLEVESWREINGIVAGQRELERVTDGVIAAVGKLGGTSTVNR